MTIREIAKIAGVSPATVSLVYNNKPGVGVEKRKLIAELLRQNGYQKKEAPKNKIHVLFIKYTRLGLVVEQNGDFITRVVDGIQNEAIQSDFDLVMRNANQTDFAMILSGLKDTEYAGVIVLGTELDAIAEKQLVSVHLPLVVVDNLVDNYDVDAVVMDSYKGAYAAVNYLASVGHKRIGYVKSRFEISNFQRRYMGYKAALADWQLPALELDTIEVSPTSDGAYRDMVEYLKRNPSLPTAFFIDNDSMMLGVVKALKQFHIKIPQDVSVIGFDDLPFCVMSDPTLSTLSTPKEAMGSLAVKRLFEKIGGNTDCLKIQMRTKLMIRESVAGPNSSL